MKKVLYFLLGGCLGGIVSAILGFGILLVIFLMGGGVHGSGFLITNAVASWCIWALYTLFILLSIFFVGKKALTFIK